MQTCWLLIRVLEEPLKHSNQEPAADCRPGTAGLLYVFMRICKYCSFTSRLMGELFILSCGVTQAMPPILWKVLCPVRVATLKSTLSNTNCVKPLKSYDRSPPDVETVAYVPLRSHLQSSCCSVLRMSISSREAYLQFIYMDNPSSRGEMKHLGLLCISYLKQCDSYLCNPTNYARNALENWV